MDVEENCPIFLSLSHPPFHLAGLGVGFEADHAAILLQAEEFLSAIQFNHAEDLPASVWESGDAVRGKGPGQLTASLPV